MRKSSLAVVLVFMWGLFGSAAAQPDSDWALEDAEGNEVRLSDFSGDPVVLHFWATWCPYCKKLQPGLDRLYVEYRDRGLQMIGISIWEEDDAEPQKALDRRGHHFKTLLNGEEVAERYGVEGTPTTVFLDAEGRVVSAMTGSDPDAPELEATVKDLLE